MAAAKYQESSSSRFSRCKYKVFLSFRGEDTRKNFTDHLYTALVQAGIHTFRDDDEIQRGENIELELKKAIQQSKISIIVFSKDYASSRWCLDELVMIMEHRRAGHCMVLPVFYDVDPSQVRKQTGCFGAAFVEHEKRFKDEMERVNGWRIALKGAADLAGKVLGDSHQAQFVHSIVELISTKLDQKIFHVPPHFIGRDSLTRYINSWLHDGSHSAAIAILHGIGGVGKTTIAKSVYNENFDKFEGSSFLANMRERSKESNGLVCLQRQLLSDVLNKTANEIYDVDEGIIKIKDAICCRRTLVVLDDVDKRDQFNAIVGMRNWLYQGSKIIITTRNKGLIGVHDECVECKVEPLKSKESLELFSWHAFGQAHPVAGFVKHCERIICHCSGLPLALRVIGSSLSRKGKEVWESALQEMEVIPDGEVLEVLKISYNCLSDNYQKNLFLDIACFFNGMEEDYVVRIVDGLGLGATFRIDNLIDRCLVEIDLDERLWMHQLIRDMGREIAHQESPKCQRVWHHMEAFTLLKETTDTETVRGLVLDMHTLTEDSCRKVVCSEDPLENSFFEKRHHLTGFFSTWEWLSKSFFGEQVQTGQTGLLRLLGMDAFKKMQNIKFLQLNYVKFDRSYEHIPNGLIWLCWHGFPLRSIPKHFSLEKLVVLDLSGSSLVDGWKGKMCLPKLKILDLRHSHALIRTPDFSRLPSLERLILEDCINLVQIHHSVGDLHSLLILNLRNCKSLVELPEEISRLNSIEQLVLDGCSNLDGLDIELEQLQQRSFLHGDQTAASLSYIRALPLMSFFPSWFSARKISRFTCYSLPSSLVELDLCRTPIRSLPESIKGSSTLNSLRLEGCQMLHTLPELPSNLQVLSVSRCYSLQRITNLATPFIVLEDCHQLDGIHDAIKLEVIQKADLCMIGLMEMVSRQMEPSLFQVLFEDNIFNVLLKGYDFLRFYKEQDEWLIQNEFQELAFKISSPAKYKVGVMSLFTRFYTSAESNFLGPVFAAIRNNTKGRSKVFYLRFVAIKLVDEIEDLLWLCHWKCGDEHHEFDNGDEVSVSVHPNNRNVQIKTVGVRMLCEKEGNEHNNNQVIAACSGSSNSSSSDAAKAQIPHHFFANYYCLTRWAGSLHYACVFQKK